MKYLHMISFCLTALLLSSCTTEIPATDTKKPLVKIFVPADSNKLIDSSDPADADEVLITLECGRNTHLDRRMYVLRGGRLGFPVRLLVVASDHGGVSMVRAIVDGGRVSNVDPVDAIVRTSTENLTTTIIEKFYPSNNPLTAGTLMFDVEPERGTTIAVNGIGLDFSSNSAASRRVTIGSKDALCGG